MNIEIPPAALEAGARAIYLTFTEVNIGDGEDHWERLLPQYRAEYRAQARATFLAIVEAWEGMQHDNYVIILPLTEKTDDKA